MEGRVVGAGPGSAMVLRVGKPAAFLTTESLLGEKEVGGHVSRYRLVHILKMFVNTCTLEPFADK